MPEPSRSASPQYRGEDLDAARGPGLGCFWIQVVLLAIAVVLTPVSAFAGWSPVVTLVLMLVVIVLLLFVGQTAIFLLRIVAAERGQRRPLAGRTRTVGEIEAAERADRAVTSDRSTEQAEPDRPSEPDRLSEPDRTSAPDRPSRPDRPIEPDRDESSGVRE